MARTVAAVRPPAFRRCRRGEERQAHMSGRLMEAIEKALDKRPLDFSRDPFDYLDARGLTEWSLPSWCHGEGDFREFRPVDINQRRHIAPVWCWLVEWVRPVLEALGADAKARKAMLSAFPRPVAPPAALRLDEVCPESALGDADRGEGVEQVCCALIGTMSAAETWLLCSEINERNARLGLPAENARGAEAMFGDIGHIPACSCPSVRGASSPAAKQWAKFHAAYDVAAVRLWGLWKCWRDVTGQEGLPAGPPYRGAKRLGAQAADFEQCVARSPFRLMAFFEHAPKRAARICEALEWLRQEPGARAERTKQSERGGAGATEGRLYVENIDNFSRVRDVKPSMVAHLLIDGCLNVAENIVKTALEEILQVPHHRKDSCVELDDIYTANVTVRGRLLATAFMLKGPGIGTKEMDIKHCGSKGNQLVRLFDAPAELFVIQFIGRIAETVVKDVEGKVTARRAQGKPAQFLIMEGQDTARVLHAYGKLKKKRRGRGRRSTG
jgi:hypothetical protein